MSIAFAQQPAGGERKPNPARDCAKIHDAENKARCVAHEKALEKCKHLNGNAHHACVNEHTPKRDN